MASRPRSNLGILTVLVLAQFMGTSLWFAGNAAAPELESLLGKTGLVPWITSAVQLGFILGTFGYAFFQIADRFSPSKVFLWSAVAAALANLSLLFLPLQVEVLLGGRFLTGVFLGGIYPVGMKIAADYVEDGLGMALGFGLTIVSIQVTQFAAGFLSPNQFIGLLCLGPVVGVWLFFSSRRFSRKNPGD